MDKVRRRIIIDIRMMIRRKMEIQKPMNMVDYYPTSTIVRPLRFLAHDLEISNGSSSNKNPKANF